MLFCFQDNPFLCIVTKGAKMHIRRFSFVEGDLAPVGVESGDVVGYMGGGEFCILNPREGRSKENQLPTNPGVYAWCFLCVIRNNQTINFNGTVATLHDINGEWHYKLSGDEPEPIKPLPANYFFEVGDGR